MTRKRFIKLLVSYGKQRNEAAQIANYYHAKGLSYEEAHTDYYIKNQVGKDIMSGFIEGLKTLNRTIQSAVKVIYKFANFNIERNDNDD